MRLEPRQRAPETVFGRPLAIGGAVVGVEGMRGVGVHDELRGPGGGRTRGQDGLHLIYGVKRDPGIGAAIEAQHRGAQLRGDIYVAKGSPAEARAQYQSALEKTEVGSPYRNLIQIKIDSLGQVK